MEIQQLWSLLEGKQAESPVRNKIDNTLHCHSDTTAPSLTNLFYLLARNPEHVKHIQKELQTVDPQDVNAVATLPHLNGAINEAMRLLPAVLTFVTRVSPPGGMHIDGIFIPGNTKIAAPRYSIGRREHPSLDIPSTFAAQYTDYDFCSRSCMGGPSFLLS